jgi:hypothetical protein
MTMMPRFSMLPGKQAIYILLARDSRLSDGKTVGVDFGCGAMLNRRISRTAEYWGVDADKPTLEKGMRRNPEARGVLSKIEDANVPPADFAICINVFSAPISKRRRMRLWCSTASSARHLPAERCW